MGLSFRGRGRGKLLLFGEHAAVKGYRALGLALETGIEITLAPDPSQKTWVLADHDEDHNSIARAVMKRIDSAVPGLAPGGTIRLRSELPIGRGFGSSAALCVALAEAALAAAGTPEAIRHRSLVWSIAHHAESYFHGSPSGIDTGLAALGGLLAFKPRPPELPETWRIVMPSLNLVVGSLPRAEGAKALIAKIAQAASPAASPAELTLGQLGALAESATTLLSQASYDPADLGALATEAEGLLAGLGLVDPGVAKLIELGRETGALGGKMSGAGGGGAFFLVYADEDAALRGCRDLGKKAERLGFGGDLTLEPLLLARAPDVGA